MDDVLTDAAPPSRFYQEDLNNFSPRPPRFPSPFLAFPDSILDKPLFPDLLVIALSDPSLRLFHHVNKKTLIGGLILPEISLSGLTLEPSIEDKSCYIYAIDGSDISTYIVCVQCAVDAERSNVVAKVLVGGNIIPKSVLILDSINSRNFRGKLSPDETYAFKLETTAERNAAAPAVTNVDYFPSGSMVDGLGAAVLAQCQMQNLRGSLLVTWPAFGNSALSHVQKLLLTKLPHSLRCLSYGNGERELSIPYPLKDHELYT